MTRDEAKEELRDPKYFIKYLDDEHGIDVTRRTKWKCLCKERHKKNDDNPSMSYDRTKNRLKCFTCNENWDIFCVYAMDNGLDVHRDFYRILNELSAKFGIEIDAGRQPRGAKIQPTTPPTPQATEPRHSPTPRPKPRTFEYADFLKQAREALHEAEALQYLSDRGISLELAERHGLGYCAQWIRPQSDENGGRPWPNDARIIFPGGDSEDSYAACAIHRTTEKNKYIKAGDAELFNPAALYKADKPIFVVEGYFDALSIEAAGGYAVALGATYSTPLLKFIDEHGAPTQPLILALDNDDAKDRTPEQIEAGVFMLKQADNAAKLERELIARGCKCLNIFPPQEFDHYGSIIKERDADGKEIQRIYTQADAEAVVTLYAGLKDANDALRADRDGFARRLRDLEFTAQTGIRIHDASAPVVTLDDIPAEEVETAAATVGEAWQVITTEQQRHYIEDRREYLDEIGTRRYLDEFFDDLENGRDAPPISTGFNKLDEALDGGLYEGLYAIGAISSLGKTAYALQIADQIAASGKDVLIVSLEMSRRELYARSISRHTLMGVWRRNGGYTDNETELRNAKTSRGISSTIRYKGYSDKEKEIISIAKTEYAEYAREHIFIMQGLGDIGVQQIAEAIDRHITFRGEAPFVIVDYLQILAPYDESYKRTEERRSIEKTVSELKRLSVETRTPIIAISSFNRANYNTPVSFEAMKESGAIEYSCDVVIGLQLKGAGGNKFDATIEKGKHPRQVELVILKNRNAGVGDLIRYDYFAMFNTFKERELERARDRHKAANQQASQADTSSSLQYR